MKKSITRIFIFSTLLLLAESISAIAQMRIVCMGNSITQGNGASKFDGSVEISYRPWLWDKLVKDGLNVDMVGYCTTYFGGSDYVFPSTTGKVFDNESEAYYGITSGGWLNGDNSSGWTGSALPKFSDRINDAQKGYTPDFALIHLGTNDDDKIVATTKNNIIETIKILRAKNPNVVVLLAKLITTWKPINGEIDGICSSLTTTASPVIAVDLATGFINDPALSGTMTYDWVHPNQQGQLFMMKRFYAALMANLNDKIKPIIIGKLTVTNVLNTSATLNWNLGTDNYGIKSYEVYANDKLLFTTNNTAKSYIANNLVAGTKYDFKVVAKDFGQNTSEALTASATTSGITGIAAAEQLDKIMIINSITNSESNINIINAANCTAQIINVYGQVVSEQVIATDSEQLLISPSNAGNIIIKIITSQGTSLIKRVIIL